MMRCDRSDILKVYLLLKDPSIYQMLCDDGSEKLMSLEYVDALLSQPKCYVLMPDDSICAIFIPRNSSTYEVHVSALASIRRVERIGAVRKMRDWIFTNTDCLKLVCDIPEYNRPAKILASFIGFSREGVNRESFVKCGKLIDQVSYGLTKGAWKCLEQ